MNRSASIVWTVLCLVCAAVPAFAADKILETFLPVPACTEGWTLQEKVTLYDKETLFDRIDGEAELYFPYGFTSGSPTPGIPTRQDDRIVIEADVYEMGSLLDAFGIYATYRRKDGADIAIGVEGTVSPAQLFFYQGRYFVRLQGIGTMDPDEGTLLFLCPRHMPEIFPVSQADRGSSRRSGLPAVEPKSERYIAKSLLGYDFFRRGICRRRDAERRAGTAVPGNRAFHGNCAQRLRPVPRPTWKDFGKKRAGGGSGGGKIP